MGSLGHGQPGASIGFYRRRRRRRRRPWYSANHPVDHMLLQFAVKGLTVFFVLPNERVIRSGRTTPQIPFRF